MIFFLAGCLLLLSAYMVLMVFYRTGWGLTDVHRISPGFEPRTRISVVVPARNEAANIAACVQSVLDQRYPADLVELIVVDDHSEDDTARIARATGGDRVQVVSLSEVLQGSPQNAYKKKALAAGIRLSTGDLIVTTDADCTAEPDWLRSIASLYEEKRPAMIIAPVAYHDEPSILGRFQSLDFMTMQGITAASHTKNLGGMANGANLAFQRQAFEAVKGYEGTEHLASGDDYLLLQKMMTAYPEGIRYLKAKEAIVRTAPQPDWGSFLRQRVRWASKSGKYPDSRLTLILLLVYLFNVALLALLLAGFFNPRLWVLWGLLVATKTGFELLLLVPVAAFFDKKKELAWFPFLQPLHILYIVVAGFLGMRGGYSWKGRQVK